MQIRDLLYSYILISITIYLVKKAASISTVAPTWMSSPYFRAGQQQIVSSFLTPTNPAATYQFLFSPAFNNTPNVAYGIKQYRGHDTFYQQNYQCRRTGVLDLTQFRVQFIIIAPTNIYKVSVAYAAIDGTFPHHIRSFQNKPINVGTVLINVNTQTTATRTFNNQVDYPTLLINQGYVSQNLPAPLSEVKILMFQTSAFFQQHSMSLPVDYSITYTIDDPQHFTIRVTIHNFVKINSMQFSMLLFNTDQIASTNKYQVIFGYVTVLSPGGTFVSGYNVQDSFVMGLFTVKASIAGCSIQYDWTIASLSPLTININLPNPLPAAVPTCTLTQSTSVYFYLRFWFCPAPYLYFNRTTDLCQNMCEMGFYQNITDYICYPCNTYISNCVDCVSYDTCSSCDLNYVVDKTKSCQQCTGVNMIADAYQFSLRKIIKNPMANQIQVQFLIEESVRQQLSSIDLTSSSILSKNQSKISLINLTLNEGYGSISIFFRYNQTIHGNYVELYFHPTVSQLNGCVLHVIFQIISENNIPVVYFYPQQYQTRGSFEIIQRAIQITSLIVVIGSAIAAKIVGIELSGVLQLWFLSLAQLDNVNLLLSPLMNMKEVNGLNIQFNQNKADMPHRIQSLNYKQDFINNCNIMIFILLAEILIGFGIFAASEVFIALRSKFSSRSANRIGKHMLKQFLLTLILFNSFNLSFSATLQFVYADPTHKDYIFSLVLSIISVLLIIAISLGLTLTDSKQFGQFKDKFKPDFASRNYCLITIAFRCSLGVYIAIMNQYQISSMIIIIFAIFFLIYNLVNLPFKDVKHNYRAIFCHLTSSVILFVSMYYRNMKANDSVQEMARVYAPVYIEVGLIAMCIIISAATLSYQLYHFICQNLWRCQNKSEKSQKGKSNQPNINKAKHQAKSQFSDSNIKSKQNLEHLQSMNQINEQIHTVSMNQIFEQIVEPQVIFVQTK